MSALQNPLGNTIINETFLARMQPTKMHPLALHLLKLPYTPKFTNSTFGDHQFSSTVLDAKSNLKTDLILRFNGVDIVYLENSNRNPQARFSIAVLYYYHNMLLGNGMVSTYQ